MILDLFALSGHRPGTDGACEIAATAQNTSVDNRLEGFSRKATPAAAAPSVA